MSAPAPTTDAALAADLAADAGRALLALRAERGHDDGRALKDAGDQASHDLLVRRLAAERPDDVVLSEEGADDPARLSADRVWIVDPLDGTREFSEEGRSDWAVHVALWERTSDDGGELIVGAVALPALDGLVLTSDPAPARDAAVGDPPRVTVSRTRPPAEAEAVAAALGAVLVPMGSAGAKVCAVVRGEVDAYVHSGGQYEWDSAAPVAVARAAGLVVTRLDGSEPVYNREGARLDDLVVCHPDLADAVREALDRI